MAYRLTISDEVLAQVAHLQEVASRAGMEARFVEAYGRLLREVLADPMDRGEIRNHYYGRIAIVLNAAIAPVGFRYAVYPGSEYVWILRVTLMGHDEE